MLQKKELLKELNVSFHEHSKDIPKDVESVFSDIIEYLGDVRNVSDVLAFYNESEKFIHIDLIIDPYYDLSISKFLSPEDTDDDYKDKVTFSIEKKGSVFTCGEMKVEQLVNRINNATRED